MTRHFNLVIAFAIYAFSLAGFLATDLYVSSQLPKETVANWAFYKSAVFILGGICLLGYDQVLVRDPALIPSLTRAFIPQALILAILGGGLASYGYGLGIAGFALLVVVVFIFASTTFLAGASRANNRLWQAQLATNGWKVVLLGFIILLPDFNVGGWFFMALIIGLLSSLLAKGYLPEKIPLNSNNCLDVKDARQLGFAFFLNNMALIFATHGEQFLINLSGNVEVSYHLFTYFAVFTPLALSVNGFVGFFLGPKIRRCKYFMLSDFARLFWWICVGATAITALSVAAGLLIFKYLHPEQHLQWLVIVGLALMCFARGVYTVPSVCLGVFAAPRVLNRISMIYWLLVGLYCAVLFAVLRISDGMAAVRLIAIISMAHWVARTIISTIYAYYTIATREVTAQASLKPANAN